MSSSGLVTILFTDLVGSTELSGEIGDAAADQLRREHFAALREAIAATGGTEVKTIGDSLMVSYPGAADALRGAVAMQQAVARHNRKLAGQLLEMRVGISVGDATFEDGDWFGTPVVEASRLCEEARGGQILVSDLVRALAGSRAECQLRPLGDREFKGLAEPVAVCEVEWSDEVDADRVPLPAFLETVPPFPFAGRVAEYDVLLSAWKDALEGTRRVLLVSGEPGIGKTRLVTELVHQAHDHGAIVLWGRCDEELDVPFEPFAEALRHYISVVDSDRLRTELGPLAGELTRMLPDLAARVPGLPEPIRTEAETERHRLFESVSDLVVAVAQQSPVVLVLDDVHWADKPSLLLLRHLLRPTAATRLLVLATYRDTDLDRSHPLADVLADLRREVGVERLDLHGLAEDEVFDLMTRTAGHELGDDAIRLAHAVHGETEGNPFFVGEVLLHLAESGAIVQRDGRWTADASLQSMGIPEGIREVVGRRLSHLSSAANGALALASVVGPQFDLATIEGAGGPSGDELFDALDEAVQAGLLREVPEAVGRYAFSHALVRQSLYEELTTNRRVRMHWRVGEALERRYASSIDEHLGELSHHFAEGALAGDATKAVEFSRRAGDRATCEVAFEAAVTHYDRALGGMELLDEPSRQLRCDLELALAAALVESGDQRSRDVTFAAAGSAREIGDARRLAGAALTLTRGIPQAVGSVDEELVALMEEALATLGEDAPDLRARLLTAQAIELQWGPERAQRSALATNGLAMARQTRDPVALGLALSAGWVLIDGSRPFLRELDDLNREYEEIAARTDDPADMLTMARQQTYISLCLGDRERSDAAHLLAHSIATPLRRPLYDWVVRADEAVLAAFYGELERGEKLILTAADVARTAGVRTENVSGVLGAHLYTVRLGQGRISEVVPVLEGLVESQPGAPVWRVALCAALVESGQVDTGRPHFDWLADDDFENVPNDVEFPVTMCGLARLSFIIRPPEPVLRSLYERLLPFSGTFNWSGVSVTDANDEGLAQAAVRLGLPDEADNHFAAAIALSERAGARAYCTRYHFDWARALAERGDTRTAAEHAEAALESGLELDMTGSHGVVPRTRELLASL